MLVGEWGHLELYHSLSSGQRHARSRSPQPLTLAISPVVIDAWLAWVREDQSKVFTDDHYLLIEQIRVISAALKFGFETFYPGIKVLQLQPLEFRFCFVSNLELSFRLFKLAFQLAKFVRQRGVRKLTLVDPLAYCA